MMNGLTRLGVVLITVYFIGLNILQVIYVESFEPSVFLMPWFISITIYVAISSVIKKYDNIEKN